MNSRSVGGGAPLPGGPSKLLLTFLGLFSSALAAPSAGGIAPVTYSYTAGVVPAATVQPYAVPTDNAAAVPNCRDAAGCVAYCPATRIADLPVADQSMKNVQLQVTFVGCCGFLNYVDMRRYSQGLTQGKQFQNPLAGPTVSLGIQSERPATHWGLWKVC